MFFFSNIQKSLLLIYMFSTVFIITYYYSPRFLDWLRFQSIGTRDYIVDVLNLMFIEVTPSRVLLGMFLWSLLIGSITFLCLLPNFFVAIFYSLLIGGLVWKTPKPIVTFLYKKRIEKFSLQMIDGLNLVTNGLRSGLSLIQAFDLVVKQMDNPISQEFNFILSQNKLGSSLDESLNDLSKRISSDDVQIFVTSILILRETGGNLADIFDTIVQTMRDRIKAEKKIEALTQQGYNQGLTILAVPPFLMLYLGITDPASIIPIFIRPLGWLILTIIVSLEILGFILIKKMLKIEI